MYCTGCGHQLNDSDRFCSQCGKGTRRESPPGEAGGYAPRRMYRLMYDKQIAGVCAGIAKYLNVDVTLVRIATVCVALFSGGLGALGYVVAWIIMPKDYGVARPAQTAQEASSATVV